MDKIEQPGTGTKIWQGTKSFGKGVGSFLGNERATNLMKGGMLIGAILGAALGIVSSTATGVPITLNIIYGLLIGIVLGGLFGFISGSVPPGASTFALFLIIIFAIYMSFATGLYARIVGEQGTAIAESGEYIWKQVSCLSPANWNKCFAEPFYKGWGTETKEQEINFDINFETTHIYDAGKDEKAVANIKVINKPENGVEKFFIEPECYIDDKKVDVNTEGIKEESKLVFYAREVEQPASVECSVPSSMLSGKDNINAKIKIIRPVKSSVKWTLTTLSSEAMNNLLQEKKSVPGENEKKGATIKHPGIPYSFGIGITPALPLPEGDYELKIELIKQSEISGKLKAVRRIEVSGEGQTAYITSCDGFKKESGKFIYEGTGKEEEFTCEFSVDPTNEANQVVFEASAEYDVEIEETRVIPILNQEAA